MVIFLAGSLLILEKPGLFKMYNNDKLINESVIIELPNGKKQPDFPKEVTN